MSTEEPNDNGNGVVNGEQGGNGNNGLEALLDHLKRSRGFDFTGYKRSTLTRRIRKRMQLVNCETYASYIDYLEVHPDEFTYLFNTILINVTGFFRDGGVWDYLSGEIVPRLLAAKEPGRLIRVWAAGCSSGEETYSLAITLAEVMGEAAFRERVKIYATDVDDEALNRARDATYAARDVSGMAPELLEKYFERIGDRYVFRKELRRSIIFGRHDLVQDAPISRIDLLVCRNTLMYFNAQTQSRILARLHFALQDHGYLFLGKAEMLLTHANLFTPVDLKRRVFSKVPRPGMRDRLLVLSEAAGEEPLNHLPLDTRLREAALETEPLAQVVVDAAGFLVLANERARAAFNLSSRDLGRPLQDLELSYRPVELRSLIEQAYRERRIVFLTDVDWPPGSGDLGDRRHLEVQVVPLIENGDEPIGASITFTDVSRYRRLQEDLEHSNQELETAYEELQSANEELETTNEELQSTNEELETTNEELQSTNEELETMNEELQSTNEELQAINEELRERTNELNHVNGFLASVLTSLRVGVAVVGRDLRVQAWNPRAEDMWGLRADEVDGHHFMSLDIGLPVDQLRQPLRACLAGDADHQELAVPATNRRGRGIQCRVMLSPLLGQDHAVQGAIVLMDEETVARDMHVPDGAVH